MSRRRGTAWMMSEQEQQSYECARTAIKAARKLLGNWTSLAQMLSRNPNMKVKLHAGATSYTDGKDLLIRVPPELAFMPEHEGNPICGKRDEYKILKCRACAILEDVNITVIHEVSHVIFGTFEEVSEYERTQMIESAIKMNAVGQSEGTRAARLRAAIEKAPDELKRDYLNLSQFISPFLPILINASEDIRVNSAMQEERPGTRVMFTAQTNSIFMRGYKDYAGNLIEWRSQPPNAQAMIAVYCKVGGFDWHEWLNPEIVERIESSERLAAVCEEMRKVTSVRGVYRLSIEVLEALREIGFMLAPDEPEDDPQPEPEQEQDESEPDQAQQSEGDEAGDEPGGSDSGDTEGDDDPQSDSGGDGDSEDGAPGHGDEDVDSESSDGQDGGASEPDEDEQQGDSSDSGGSSEAGPDSEGEGDGSDAEGDRVDPSSDQDGDDSGSDSDGSSAGEQPADGQESDGDGDDSDGDDPGGSGTSREDDPGTSREDDPGADGEAGDSDSGGDSAGDASDEGTSGGSEDAPGEPEDGDSSGGSDSSGEAGDSSGSPTDGNSNNGVDDSAEELPESEQQSGSRDGSSSGEAGDDSDDSGQSESDSGESGQSDGGGAELPEDGDTGGEVGSGDQADEAPVRDDDGRADVHQAGPGEPSASDHGSADDPDVEQAPAEATPAHDSDEAGGSGAGEVEFDVASTPDEAAPGNDVGDTPQVDASQPYTQEDMDRDGRPETIEKLLLVFGRHDEDDSSNKLSGVSEKLEQAMEEMMETALRQMDFFDMPSVNVGGVNVYKRGCGEAAWEDGYHHVWGDPIEVPEKAITGSLLELRLAFQDNARGKVERHRRAGKVDPRVLARRAPAEDDRLFKKKTQPGRKDYFVLIGLDCSGSTAHHIESNVIRLSLIKAAAYAKAEMLHRLGVSFAIYAHSGNRDAVAIFEIKAAKEPWGKEQKQALEDLQPYSGNIDGHTLEYYRKVCEARPETDKLLLYYTDGHMPAANYDEELFILQREIKLCDQLGIKLIGVGVNSDAPTEHGLDTIRLDDIGDLQKVVKGLKERML